MTSNTAPAAPPAIPPIAPPDMPRLVDCADAESAWPAMDAEAEGWAERDEEA
jgi:hypothetical protein